jgi:hypothetical protein
MALASTDWFRQIITSTAGEILAAPALLAVGTLINRLKGGLEARHPKVRRALLLLPWLVFALVNVVYYRARPDGSVLPFLGTTAAMLLITAYQFNQFWRVGLVGSDRTLTSGLDFKRSLSLCHSSLEFLGVGAAKLVATGTTFEDAVHRCQRPERSVRFLLCSPGNADLESIAKQAGKPKEDYREELKKSLRTLARLGRERRLNVEVRLYAKLPIFRLMFIDDELCLVSHYRFGDNDGSTLPQVHVRKSDPYKPGARSLYYGFHRFYEDLWKDSDIWDFRKYL